MFLIGVSEIITQRIARWESFTFLDYIRKQVENITQKVSRKIIKMEKFQHLNVNYFRVDEKTSRNKAKLSGDGDSNIFLLSNCFSKQVLCGKDERVDLI